MIKRFAAALGVIVFLVVAGTSVSYAYWTATAGMTATVQIANPAVSNCSNIVALTNGGFETPQLSDNSWSSTTTPTGWTSRAPGTNTARGFEMWRGSVVSPILPAAGAQNLELNSDNPTTTYQQVATTPGQVLRYGFWHRGRDSATVGDVVKLTIGAPTTNAADASATTSTGAVLAQLYTTTSTAWAYYSGSYTVPAGQTTTRLSLTSVSVGGGNQTQGNLIDDVTFGTGPCVTATSTVSNVTTGGTTYRVGDTVRFVTTIANSGGAVAAASVAKVVLPTNLTLVSGSIRIGTAAQTNATGDDLGEYVSGTRTVIARIGAGATTGLGGRVSNASPLTVSYDAVIGTGALGGTVTHMPTVEFVDEAVPTWTLSATGAILSTPVQGDVTAPTVPGTPVFAATSGTSTQVSWAASTDAVGVTAYEVTRIGPAGSAIAYTGTALTFTDGGLSAGQPYVYRVRARDAAGNWSALSGDGGVVTSFGSSQYTLSWTSGATTRCLGASANGNSNLVSESCSSGADGNQRWTFTLDDSSFRISPVETPSRGWRTNFNNGTAGTSVGVHGSSSGATRALWSVAAVTDGTRSYLQIRTAFSTDNCVTVPGGSTSTTQAALGACTVTDSYRRFVVTQVVP